jgi:DNA-binding NarL/FixJ family response regulator
MKVLIVDDAPLVRERLRALLQEVEGIEMIAEAEEQLEAIDRIKEIHPDVLILDIRLRGGSGINVLHKIKNHELFPTVIIFTNYPYPRYREQYTKAGAHFFFDKSTEFERIPEILKMLIQSSPAMRSQAIDEKRSTYGTKSQEFVGALYNGKKHLELHE